VVILDPVQSRVLIVDDDRDTRLLLGSLLSADGHACELAADAVAAMRSLESHGADLVLSDVLMEGLNGLELLDRVKRTRPDLPVVLVTAAGAVVQAVEAIKRGAFQYVTKPCDPDMLRQVVREGLEARPNRKEPAPTSPAPPRVADFDLVGSGPSMCALQTIIDSVARSSAPVLVTGETGVGKELVARAIHARSARSQRAFVPVNMSAIPKELMEAELFGHARGAFTGAAQPRKGLFIEADGGTLMLDEIGDMSFPLQAKLLRVLQSGEVRPVGGERVRRVDVRIIAATHRDLPVLVREGRFREDLFFRLNVLPVFVPPLRERREDIPALATHLLAQARQRAPHSPVRSIAPEALTMLSEAPWRGNVRELASFIERAVVFGTGEFLHVDTGLAEDNRSPRWPFGNDAPWPLRRLSRTYAEWVLSETGGNRQRAAEILDVDLSTLYRWRRGGTD
jgi:two-component system response regulator HydG